MEICRVEPGGPLWRALAEYARGCPWIAGAHLADMLEKNAFTDWESAFAALEDGRIAGFCTLLKTDYYPENRYSPWISSIFVDEAFRGRRLSGRLIECAAEYAWIQGFKRVYIPSEFEGLYEKYGFEKIDALVNYGGDVDHIFARTIG